MNKFDNIEIDLNEIYRELDKIPKDSNVRSFGFLDWLVILFTGMTIKLGIRRRLLFGNFLLGWFEQFNAFWKRYLKGRPIDITDFHFLKGIHRIRFQNIEIVGDDKNEKTYLEAWQNQENIYLLFSGLWRYAKSAYLDFMVFFKYLPKSGKILEYGCGIAPITTGINKYLSHRKYDLVIADILQLNFCYAKYKLNRYRNIEIRLLEPSRNLIEESGEYDAIVCLTVFEHLPNPLAVAKSFHASLGEKGIFIFDYLKSDGKGLDSKSSLAEREETLEFIKEKFDILKGEIKTKGDMGLIAARKRK